MLTVVRAQPKGMWFINLKPHKPVPSYLVLSTNTYAVLNYAHNIKSNKNLILFYHRCCNSPVISTWKVTIRKSFFATLPSIVCTGIDKYLDKSIATTKGHIHQTQQGVRSTQPTLVNEDHHLNEAKTRDTYIKT